MIHPVLRRWSWCRGRAALTRSRCASPTSPASGRGNLFGCLPSDTAHRCV